MRVFGRTDAPESKSDKLLTNQYAQGLASFILGCQTPLTIGVQGAWGSGKTSLMRMVESALSNSKQPKLLSWFDTWQYGALGEDEALGVQLLIDLNATLMEVLRTDADAQRLGSKISKMLNSVYGFARKAGRVGKALAAGVASFATNDLVNGEVLMSDADGNDGGARVSLSRIRELFQKLVGEYVTKAGGPDSGARMVVFVDDLDRIRPGRAVALLEVMKNFIEIEHCVFVIACDQEVVREGVRERFGIADRRKEDAFFHKLFQVPFEMPVDAYDNTRFLQDYVRTLLNPTTSITTKTKKINDDRATEIAMRVNDAVTLAIGTNPRALKRFFNLSDLLLCVDMHRIGESPTSKINTNDADIASVFLALVAMHTTWPDLTAYMARLDSFGQFQTVFATLTGDSEVPDEELDEELEAHLQAKYGRHSVTASDWRTSEDVQKIARFIRAFSRILSPRKEGGAASNDFLLLQDLLKRMRLAASSSDLGFHTPFFRLREAAMRIDSDAGDAFFGIVRALDTRFARDSRFTILRADARYSLQVNSDFGNRISPMALYVKEEPKQLLIRLNLGSKAASGAGCEELAAIGAKFIEDTRQNIGVQWTANGEGFRLDFVQSRVPQERMDDFRSAVLELHDACAVALARVSAQLG